MQVVEEGEEDDGGDDSEKETDRAVAGMQGVSLNELHYHSSKPSAHWPPLFGLFGAIYT